MVFPVKTALRRTAIAAVAAVLAGCGGKGPDAVSGDAGALTGTIRVDGSSTVYPLTEAVAEEYMKVHPRVRVIVGVSGTGGGFSKFVRGETDINDASRPIKPSEQALAEANGIAYVELPVAFDGLSVVVHPGNDWVSCLTISELSALWEPSSDIGNWRQLRSDFPDRELRLYGAGTDSGTYDYFTAAVVGEEGASRSDFTASEDDNVLVQGVAGDRSSLAFLPYAYYAENRERLKLLGVDDENPENGLGCVQPGEATVQSGEYQPLARPEFIYVSASSLQRPAVVSFVNFYLDNAATLAREVGYVGLSREAYRLGRERVARRRTGSAFNSDGSRIGVRIEDLLKIE